MQGNLDPMTFNMMLNMMNVMHPNMGYNSNNYNYNMNNSADDELDEYESITFTNV